jgi:hypothetical protein
MRFGSGWELSPLCGPKDRQMSEVSTILPWSPQKSPEADVELDDHLEFDGDDVDFEMDILDQHGVACKWTCESDDIAEKQLDKSQPKTSTSEAILSAVQATHLASPAPSSNVAESDGFNIIMPVLIGLVMYGLWSSVTFRIFMGAVAAMMLLPGVYLYAVDGCRPEDYNEDKVNQEKYGFGTKQVLLMASVLFSSIHGVSASMVFRALSGVVAVLMVLPGIYLYVAEGCRPEGYEDEGSDRKTGVTGIFLIAGSVLGSLYCMCTYMVFRALMGVVAVLMVLPGIYLYVVEGCRPEGYAETKTTSASLAGVILIASCFLGSAYGMYTYMLLRAFMGIVAVLMVLPGIYLYVAEGCRPEGYEEDKITNTSAAGVILIAGCFLGSAYGMYSYMLFRVFMGCVAVLMVLPGIYLYVVEGCRPEGYEEEKVTNTSAAGVILIAGSFLGLVYGMYSYMLFRVSMGCVAALMVLPGIYLYTVEGCRPEGYEDIHSKMGAGSGVHSLVSDLLDFIANSKSFQVLTGVEVCKSEDDEEQLANEKDGELPKVLIASLLLGCTFGMYTSCIFRVLMRIVAVAMFLPGIYLYVVDGSRPEDYEAEPSSKKME